MPFSKWVASAQCAIILHMCFDNKLRQALVTEVRKEVKRLQEELEAAKVRHCYSFPRPFVFLIALCRAASVRRSLH
jgi:histidinol-phosphate/aromatic aminotransferase/cobyric acid decarboxylase-like protein